MIQVDDLLQDQDDAESNRKYQKKHQSIKNSLLMKLIALMIKHDINGNLTPEEIKFIKRRAKKCLNLISEV